MTPAPIELVAFDLDGTLVDTGDEIAMAANDALASLGLPPRGAAEIVRHVGHGGRELMRRLLHDAGAAAVDVGEAHRRFDASYGGVVGSSARAYPGCGEALGRLAAAGVQLACITNKSERFSRVVLDACGIAARFAIVVGGDTLPSRKPDRGVVDHVLLTLGADAAATVLVGDSRTDVATARAAGIAAWAVPWGYNAGEPIVSANPDRVFASFTEIAAAVLASRVPSG